MNSAVMVGTNVFMHNVHPNGTNPDSDWRDGPFDQLVRSTLTAHVFEVATQFDAANQVFKFDSEIKPNEYSQNEAAAANAGVVLAAMLPLLELPLLDAAI